MILLTKRLRYAAALSALAAIIIPAVTISVGDGNGEDTSFGSKLADLLHEYLFLYLAHLVAALLSVVMTLYHPKIFMVVMACSGLLWPLSYATNVPIWHQEPLSKDWWLTFIKWVIVNSTAAIPVLYIQAYKPRTSSVTDVCAIFVYVILGANIIWTLLYEMPDWTRKVNGATGVSLTLSLIMHCYNHKIRHGRKLFENDHGTGMLHGYGTPLAWLVSYTIWNALFVAEFSMGMTFQDVLFWAMMYAMQFLDTHPKSVELYFAIARPVQLGAYIALGCWAGLGDSYFTKASDLDRKVPLQINHHAYFFFICCCNFVWSLYVLVWSFMYDVASEIKRAPRDTCAVSDAELAELADLSSEASSTISARHAADFS